MPNHNAKNEWRKKRKEEYRDLRDNQYYIFCEGEKTEPNYFKSFKKSIEHNAIYKDMVLIEIDGLGESPKGVLKTAEDFVKDHNVKKGQIWCVFDKDDFTADNFDGTISKISELNKKSSSVKYFAAWSNQCIEIWFLLHFSDYIADNHRKEYIKALNASMKKWGKKYKKNDAGIFDYLLEHGDPKQAIKFAKRKIKSEKKPPSQIAPGTNVFALVEELAKYLPQNEQEKFI